MKLSIEVLVVREFYQIGELILTLNRRRRGMRFFALCLLLFALVICISAQAQNYVGVVGGLNLANIDLDPNPGIDFDRLNRMAIGGVLGLQLVDHLKLHIEPMYLQKGARQKDFDLSLGDSEFKYKIETVELPVLLRLDLTSSRVQPYLLAGPTAAVITNTTVEVTASGIEFKGDADNTAKTFDFGVGFGGGLSVQFGGQALFLEGRCSLGLSNVNEGGDVSLESENISEVITIDPDDVSTRGLQVMAGIVLSL
jgi:hypothetical protein